MINGTTVFLFYSDLIICSFNRINKKFLACAKPSNVIPGPDPGIHFDFESHLSINVNFNMDCRVKPGNDGGVSIGNRVIKFEVDLDL